MEVGGAGGGERPPWIDIVRVVSMAVGALALVAIAFFVKDMRDDTRRQSCLASLDAFGLASARVFDAVDFVDAVEDCGYDVPDDQEP